MSTEMAPDRIQINRAPVLTLWAAVVAKRLGFNRDEALSLGKALAGLNAQSKGRRYSPRGNRSRIRAPGELGLRLIEAFGQLLFLSLCGQVIVAGSSSVIHSAA